MIGQYKGLIPENIAPKGVETISIYDSDNVKKASMAVPEFMRYPAGAPLYSFGVVSDSHCNAYNGSGLDAALAYLKGKGCPFVCHCGDITNVGLYQENGTRDESQFEKYKSIVDKYTDSTFSVYEITGNHDSYVVAITEDMDLFQQYTGNTSLHYAVEYGGDVFLFIGQPAGSVLMSEEAFTWLGEQLATHSSKRCFLFIHPYIPNDSGNVLQCYGNNIVGAFGQKDAFLNALRNHGNVTVFHGHSHFLFGQQELDRATNYTRKNGFHSVHVPSVDRGAVVTNDSGGNPQRTYVDRAGQFYWVEVFGDCIVLNGVDISLEEGSRIPKLIPQGIIRISTRG